MPLLVAVLSLSGCTLFGSAPTETPKDRPSTTISEAPSTSVSVEEVPPAPIPNTKVEIIWSIPEQPVDGFMLHYGGAPDQLTANKKLLITELEKYQDPERGAVYRYILTDVPPDKPVYIALSAFIGEANSGLSEVREILP